MWSCFASEDAFFLKWDFLQDTAASGVHAIPERVDSRGAGRIVLADYPPAGAWPLALGASSVIGAETRIPAPHTLPGFAAGAGTRGKS